MYNVDSLRQGIIKAGENIKMFEDAIQKEKDTIAEYERMIKVIEEKKAFDEAKKRIEQTVEIERE